MRIISNYCFRYIATTLSKPVSSVVLENIHGCHADILKSSLVNIDQLLKHFDDDQVALNDILILSIIPMLRIVQGTKCRAIGVEPAANYHYQLENMKLPQRFWNCSTKSWNFA